MIKISKIFQFIKFNHLSRIINPSLTTRLTNNFTLTTKKSQLILHSQGQIQKMHNKKSNKNKAWQPVKQTQKNQFRVSLIGLPNSGKSTLFNCLIGERLAIVDKHPGMTRDRRQYQIMEGLVKVIDTPGVQISAFGKKEENNIKHDIFKQTVTAIHQSDLIIVVIDSTKPVSNEEIQMIKYLRKFANTQKIIVACTKSQKIFDESSISDQVSKLALDKVFFCSGENGSGVFQILEYIDSQVANQAKQNLKKIKQQRVAKFEQLIKKLKQQMKELQEKGINIKQWQRDFRKINPDPEFNTDLDHQNFQQFIMKPQKAFSSTRGTQIKNLKMKNTIKICFIGRPNVGKSSLINQILGEERLVVSETPHTTRDSIPNKIFYKNRKIELIDTAGLENHIIEKTQEEYLKKAQYSTMLHVKQSNVVVYVMDSLSAFKIQDFKLIRKVIQQGRPIVIAVNKWQAIKQQYKYKAKNYLYKQIEQNLGHMVHGHPIVFVSAKLNDGIDNMIDNIITAYDKWNSRISTGLLNNWLQKFKKLDNLPKDDQFTLRINYVIQAKVRPPHYIFFVNNRKLFKDNYMRFVTENMAKQFKMDGIPFRITLRSTNNKQNERKNKPSLKKIQHNNPYKTKMQQLKKKYNNFGL